MSNISVRKITKITLKDTQIMNVIVRLCIIIMYKFDWRKYFNSMG